jgi:Na+-driven multidrug efflux pump
MFDVAMTGPLGETALAASALASNLNYIPYVLGIGVVTDRKSLFANVWGKGPNQHCSLTLEITPMGR